MGPTTRPGVKVLIDALDADYAGLPVTLIFGVFADKDSEPMMRALFPRVQKLVLTPLDNPRSKDPKSYEAFARTLNADVEVATSASDALDKARRATEGLPRHRRFSLSRRPVATAPR